MCVCKFVLGTFCPLVVNTGTSFISTWNWSLTLSPTQTEMLNWVLDSVMHQQRSAVWIYILFSCDSLLNRTDKLRFMLFWDVIHVFCITSVTRLYALFQSWTPTWLFWGVATGKGWEPLQYMMPFYHSFISRIGRKQY